MLQNIQHQLQQSTHHHHVTNHVTQVCVALRSSGRMRQLGKASPWPTPCRTEVCCGTSFLSCSDPLDWSVHVGKTVAQGIRGWVATLKVAPLASWSRESVTPKKRHEQSMLKCQPDPSVLTLQLVLRLPNSMFLWAKGKQRGYTTGASTSITLPTPRPSNLWKESQNVQQRSCCCTLGLVMMTFLLLKFM